MGVIISGLSSTNRDFSDAENAAIDAHTISLSEGNWREHMLELSVEGSNGTDAPAEAVETAAADYIEWFSRMLTLTEHRRWHLDMARKVLELARATRANGGDTIGVAG